MKTRLAQPTRTRRLLRIVVRLVKAAAFALLLAAVWSTSFIALKCYSGGSTNESASEAATFLTLPEWYIVYNTEEYARHLRSDRPSRFPYFRSIAQYWRYYGSVCAATRGVYPFDTGNHLMLAVIGSSFSIEYAIKGIYENTVGRLTEWIGGWETPEDEFARATSLEYGAFMHTVPWYEFPFRAKLSALWRTTAMRGPAPVRKWERRLALTAEYGVKAAYGWLIGRGSQAAYGNVPPVVEARVTTAAGQTTTVKLPRYEAFTGRALAMLKEGTTFVQIGGHDLILVTALAPAAWDPGSSLSVVLSEPLLTDPKTARLAVRAPVASLHEVIARLEAGGARIEHLYDY